jgi:hypothetical protein
MVEVQKKDYEIALALKRKLCSCTPKLSLESSAIDSLCRQILPKFIVVSIIVRLPLFLHLKFPTLVGRFLLLNAQHHLSAFCEAGASYLG